MTPLAPLWTELTSWLAGNAPQTLEWLRPAGDPARLTAAEEQLGFALPAELTEWWHLHDGSVAGPFLPGYDLYGVDDMRYAHRIQLEVNLEEEVNEMARRNLGLPDDVAGGPSRYFPRELVPVGGDGFGNHLVVDCRPGPEYGRLRVHDHESRGEIWPPEYDSLADLLTQMLGALRTGQPLKRRTPTVEAGALCWHI